MAKWIMVAFVAVMVIGNLSGTKSTAQDPNPGQIFLRDGLMFIEAKNGMPQVLRKTQVMKIGGREFLVGEEVADSDLVRPVGIPHVERVWLPVDAITRIVEYNPKIGEKK